MTYDNTELDSDAEQQAALNAIIRTAVNTAIDNELAAYDTWVSIPTSQREATITAAIDAIATASRHGSLAGAHLQRHNPIPSDDDDPPAQYGHPDLDKAAQTYTEIETVNAGKRCAVDWYPAFGDWFMSCSPRNRNSNAEGPWAHWVDLALQILQDPLTAKTRPDAHAAVQALQLCIYQGDVDLTDTDLRDRFTPATTKEQP